MNSGFNSISDWTVKLLLVDDNPSITDLGKEILERESDRFTTITAEGGRSALEIIQNEDIEVDGVISDYEMPDMDGLELLEETRIEDENLPFFIYTGQGSDKIASEAVKFDVNSYMPKSNSALDDWKIMGNQMLREVDQYRINKIQEAMLTYSEAIITLITPEGKIIYSSPESEMILGLKEGERSGENAIDYIHPDDTEKIREKITYLLESDDDEKVEATFRYKTGDGQYIELEGVASYQPEMFEGIVVNSIKKGN